MPSECLFACHLRFKVYFVSQWREAPWKKEVHWFTQKPNSWTYNFIEVSGHNLECSQQGCGSAFISSGSGSRSGSSILGWIPNGSGSNTDPDPDPIRIQGFNDQNLKKITLEKKSNFFGSKTAIYLSLGLHKERPSYRRSFQLSKEAIQHFKT
jgi:hypothetical protein